MTLICRGVILKQLDRDIVDELMKNMKNLGVEIRLDCQHTHVVQEEDGTYTIHCKSKDNHVSKINTDRILLAVGRPPNVDALNLQNTAI